MSLKRVNYLSLARYFAVIYCDNKTIIMTLQTISFSRTDSAQFFKTLNQRVNTYFKENNIKRTGNWKPSPTT